MNRRRHFHQRWLLWGLVWVFMLASLAPAISRMQAAGALAAAVQVADGKPDLTTSAATRKTRNDPVDGAASSVPAEAVRQADQVAAGHTICFPDAETAARFAQEAAGKVASPAAESRIMAVDPHAGHGHHGGLTGEPDNLFVQLSVSMPSLDCCPFCSIMADRLAPVWFDVPLLLDRTLVRARPLRREPMPPAVAILRLPPVRGPPAASPSV